ncbi:ribonuclease Z [Thermoleophilia bacterium SCSIO 60948]|nr:ribonuclease Z [Thermoleophilia bacterium SCSIO 60948]
MDLDLTFLGTGGSVPSARRSTASVLIRAGGDRLMIDCGEGTQRQMQRAPAIGGVVQVDDLFLTHFHADHVLGVPGLLSTYGLHDRERPLRVIGPVGLEALFTSFRRSVLGRLPYELDLIELADGDSVRGEGFEVYAFGVDHRTPALGYALVEDDRPGRLDPQAAQRLGVAPGPDFGRLQRGEAVEGSNGTVRPEQVVGEDRRGRRIVVTGDTRPCRMTAVAAEGAELLVHDATFADEDSERAEQTGHSTARQAARLGAEAGVSMLALVHISSRIHVGALLDEAREEFPGALAPRDFDVVEIPMPERGEPKLVRGDAPAS